MADIAALTSIIEPEVKAEGLELVRVMMIGGTDDPTLQVMAERPDTRQLNLADCERLHRRIVERHEALTEDYRIEVSSPGIDRPLTRLKDFDMWEGYEARIETEAQIDGRKRFKGILVGTEADEVLINIEDGANGIQTIGLKFDWLTDAKLILTDELIAEMLRQRKASGTFDEADFDEIQETTGDEADDAEQPQTKH